MEKNSWKHSDLYRLNSKQQLEAQCRKLNIPVTARLSKHQLVELIAGKQGKDPPIPSQLKPLYNGDLSRIPATTSAINRLTVAHLKAILSYHHISTIGSKEQLVLRTYFLRISRTTDIVAREDDQLKDLIEISRKIIQKQRELSFSSHIYRRRKYTLSKTKSCILIPNHVHSAEELGNLYNPLLEHLEKEKERRALTDRRGPLPLYGTCVVEGSVD